MTVHCQAIPNSAADCSGFSRLLRGKNASGIVMRNDFLCAAGAIAILSGLLFPPFSHIIDVLFIFSIFLTAAVVMISISARGPGELAGFPALLLLATALRMSLGVACCKLIIAQGYAGDIVNFIGGLVVGENRIPALVLYVVLAGVFFRFICKVVKTINRTFNSSGHISPYAGFFLAMNAAGRLIFADALVGLILVAVNILAILIAVASPPTVAQISVNAYATGAVGAGLFTHISAVIVAVTSGYLVQKTAFCALNEPVGTKRIRVVASEVTVKPAAPREPTPAPKVRLWSAKKIKDGKYYDRLANLILTKSGPQTRTIIMAAENVQQLPVTIPVNVAMSLAKNDKKCLLLDLDFERAAVAKAFDLNTENLNQNQPIQTCIKNIRLCPVTDSAALDVENLGKLVFDYNSCCDYVIIYAPVVGARAFSCWEKAAGFLDAAMFFGSGGASENHSISGIYKLLESSGVIIF
ncbi:MAG TPA: FHIPEP family type III secretion protein [Sedimentisphaerales bacterium]|nr:FHIPEP family type III secretion protein [Sedimentisphaerales bacterium]